MTQNIMEQASPPFNHNKHSGGNERPARSDVDNKRLKELRNAALQTTLTARMEGQSPADSEVRHGEDGEEPPPPSSNGLPSFNQRRRSDNSVQAAPGPAATGTERGEGPRLDADDDDAEEEAEAEEEEEGEEMDSNVTNDKVAEEEERTLTDHLNKRLLSSFLEKLNQRDLALPGVQHVDCAVAEEEDSNRAAEDW